MPAGTARESAPLRSGTDGSHPSFLCRADLRRRDMVSNQSTNRQEDVCDLLIDIERNDYSRAHSRAKKGLEGMCLLVLPKINVSRK